MPEKLISFCCVCNCPCGTGTMVGSTIALSLKKGSFDIRSPPLQRLCCHHSNTCVHSAYATAAMAPCAHGFQVRNSILIQECFWTSCQMLVVINVLENQYVCSTNTLWLWNWHRDVIQCCGIRENECVASCTAFVAPSVKSKCLMFTFLCAVQ